MPLSPPAGKPRIKVTASEGQLGYSPMSDGRTSVYSEASFGKEEALAVAAVFDTLYDRDGSPADDRTTVSYASSAMVVDRPGLTILTAQGTKPTVVTRISGKFGADGDLDGDDFLEEYALDKMVVDIDDDGLRSTCYTLTVNLYPFAHPVCLSPSLPFQSTAVLQCANPGTLVESTGYSCPVVKLRTCILSSFLNTAVSSLSTQVL